MRRAELRFLFDSSEDARVVFKSLTPEVKKRIPKTTVELDFEGREMVLSITASDTSSLRAAINSYLRWVDTAFKVKDVL
ncbi:MAG TPA: hypothetical protein ENL13_00885 [Thermoplasmatales archaeon]|nr:hypothetical protein [Thermoplasmatales archaeon]